MTGPLILIALGILFLLENLYPGAYPFSRVWPIILIVIGLAKVLESIVHRVRGGEPPSGKETE
jgi:Domain of unknown function (DUF5668)